MSRIVLIALVTGALVFISPRLYASIMAFTHNSKAQTMVVQAAEKGQTTISFKHLEYLDLIPQNISSLNRLKLLELSGTNIHDIQAVADLAQLEVLRIANTEVTDISALKSAPSLQKLDIGRTGISDLSPLANLNNLEWLQMDQLAVQSLCPTTKLNKLNWLNLHKSHALDGSKACFERLEGRISQLTGGNAFRQNYQPGTLYQVQTGLKRFLKEWHWL